MALNKTRPQGFSLLELLLVLVIVGLIVSLAGLSVSSGSRPYVVEGSVRVFADVAEYAMDEAQLVGTDMGLLLRRQRDGKTNAYSYQWLQRKNTTWVPPLVDPDTFSARNFPPDVELRLEVEEGATELAAGIDTRGDGQVRPQVIFYSSGETTPGILTLVDAGSGKILWELEWDLLGRMTLKREGREDDEN